MTLATGINKHSKFNFIAALHWSHVSTNTVSSLVLYHNEPKSVCITRIFHHVVLVAVSH